MINPIQSGLGTQLSNGNTYLTSIAFLFNSNRIHTKIAQNTDRKEFYMTEVSWKSSRGLIARRESFPLTHKLKKESERKGLW